MLVYLPPILYYTRFKVLPSFHEHVLLLFYRIDGKLVNLTARVGQKMKLANGTVVMDIQKTFSSQSDETGVVLISLQYESGLFNFLMVGLFPSAKKQRNYRQRRKSDFCKFYWSCYH